jgi:hypothetical protein
MQAFTILLASSTVISHAESGDPTVHRAGGHVAGFSFHIANTPYNRIFAHCSQGPTIWKAERRPRNGLRPPHPLIKETMAPLCGRWIPATPHVPADHRSLHMRGELLDNPDRGAPLAKEICSSRPASRALHHERKSFEARTPRNAREDACGARPSTLNPQPFKKRARGGT